MSNEIRLNLAEDEFVRLLAALSEANETILAADVSEAWLKVTEQRMAAIEVLAKLQTVRGYLYRLKGYLEAEAAGYPRVDLDWTTKSLEIVKALQLEVWECQSTR